MSYTSLCTDVSIEQLQNQHTLAHTHTRTRRHIHRRVCEKQQQIYSGKTKEEDPKSNRPVKGPSGTETTGGLPETI